MAEGLVLLRNIFTFEGGLYDRNTWKYSQARTTSGCTKTQEPTAFRCFPFCKVSERGADLPPLEIRFPDLGPWVLGRFSGRCASFESPSSSSSLALAFTSSTPCSERKRSENVSKTQRRTNRVCCLASLSTLRHLNVLDRELRDQSLLGRFPPSSLPLCLLLEFL